MGNTVGEVWCRQASLCGGEAKWDAAKCRGTNKNLQAPISALLTKYVHTGALRKHTLKSLCTYLAGVYLHLMERIDCDEDVAHIRVNLISSIATLKLLCDRVLKKKKNNNNQNHA